MKSSFSDICHTPNRNLIFCICHTLENKAAVAKSKLQPLHWQQRERPALRKVCLGRNIMAIFLISEESKNGSKGRSFLTKCLHGWKKWWWFTLICSRSRNASLQCSQPRRCHPGKPPGHQPIPWDFFRLHCFLLQLDEPNAAVRWERRLERIAWNHVGLVFDLNLMLCRIARSLKYKITGLAWTLSLAWTGNFSCSFELCAGKTGESPHERHFPQPLPSVEIYLFKLLFIFYLFLSGRDPHEGHL